MSGLENKKLLEITYCIHKLHIHQSKNRNRVLAAEHDF